MSRALNWEKTRTRRPDPEPRWRRLPPTRKQLDFISCQLGWPPEYVKGRNRGEVSDLIAQMMRDQPKGSRGKAAA